MQLGGDLITVIVHREGPWKGKRPECGTAPSGKWSRNTIFSDAVASHGGKSCDQLQKLILAHEGELAALDLPIEVTEDIVTKAGQRVHLSIYIGRTNSSDRGSSGTPHWKDGIDDER